MDICTEQCHLPLPLTVNQWPHVFSIYFSFSSFFFLLLLLFSTRYVSLSGASWYLQLLQQMKQHNISLMNWMLSFARHTGISSNNNNNYYNNKGGSNQISSDSFSFSSSPLPSNQFLSMISIIYLSLFILFASFISLDFDLCTHINEYTVDQLYVEWSKWLFIFTVRCK